MLKKLEQATMIVLAVLVVGCFIAIPFAVYHDFHKIGLVE